jgi:hypothetical protein
MILSFLDCGDDRPVVGGSFKAEMDVFSAGLSLVEICIRDVFIGWLLGFSLVWARKRPVCT